ncbi:MAG: hypothetical protein US57_C0003G0005 [Candidatus Moranbacteria bacterium GW2011_GWC2_37_73]|nr:MAG: hypothetical protein UR95_C0003G0054 [Parcubacteria group bacterium GW2011_GWC1_36_108]KKQ01243.1 MAG: hypothetical protein US09_C0001G0003 [Candidatus Moranbacteria bacterium GW2011_GWD1_36_198]KKQ02302.1 MAG: hypothetical protein US10_C0003G0003 [Candidatus Moranbacteria bacterium GW2011_GWD2_36_198]KKQ40197.1 MAG: hypothetical protein US57_C0003G0005 [Candidatus Moranbacteria bacterium GW2011_GWC2_37_73]
MYVRSWYIRDSKKTSYFALEALYLINLYTDTRSNKIYNPGAKTAKIHPKKSLK